MVPLSLIKLLVPSPCASFVSMPPALAYLSSETIAMEICLCGISSRLPGTFPQQKLLRPGLGKQSANPGSRRKGSLPVPLEKFWKSEISMKPMWGFPFGSFSQIVRNCCSMWTMKTPFWARRGKGQRTISHRKFPRFRLAASLCE